MIGLVNLPYDTLQSIFEFFTINDLNIIHNLVLTSKTFNTPDPQNRINLCVRQSRKIAENIINIFKETNGAHTNPFVIPPPLNYVTRYEKWIYKSIRTIKNKFSGNDGTSILWSHIYNGLVGAYIVGEYQFIHQMLVPRRATAAGAYCFVDRILGGYNIQTYHEWGDTEKGLQWKQHFEGIFIIIIKISIHVLQLTIDGPNNLNIYLDEEMRDHCIKTLNYMLNKRYKTETWYSQMGEPGLYELLGSNNLYDRVVDAYHSEKSKLCKSHQKYISNNVFDNKDFENIKMHCDNNTLNKYTCKRLKAYIKTRQPRTDYGYMRRRCLNGNKAGLIKFITEYIA